MTKALIAIVRISEENEHTFVFLLSLRSILLSYQFINDPVVDFNLIPYYSEHFHETPMSLTPFLSILHLTLRSTTLNT